MNPRKKQLPNPRKEKAPVGLSPFEFYRDYLGDPKYILAPMVDGSELAFRLLVRKYGVQLAYSPMMFSRIGAQSDKYFRLNFQTCDEDKPLVAQFCGTDPETMVKAAKKVQTHCEVIDINMGCPQNCARQGGYGAFLMDRPEEAQAIVHALHQNLTVPVFCKIRIKNGSIEETISYAQGLVNNGASCIALHARTREMKGKFPGNADWNAVRELKRHLNVPVIANGNIRDKEDADRCMAETGCDGVMSAWGLLDNPALFSGESISGKPLRQIQIAREYGAITEVHETTRKLQDAHYYPILFEIFEKMPYFKRKFEVRGPDFDIYAFLDELEGQVLNPTPNINEEGLASLDALRELRKEKKALETAVFDWDDFACDTPEAKSDDAESDD